jgi:hypothetical protein
MTNPISRRLDRPESADHAVAIARTASVMAARIMASAMTRRISSETESSLVVAGDICADEPVISFDDLFGSNEQVRGNLEAK